MPIECRFQVKPLEQDAFHEIDKVAMRHAFDIHNEMGRFLDERIYQDELAYRCIKSGIETLREPTIFVTHLDFCKLYFLDILADTGAIYKLKAVKALGGSHETQLINYLLLTGLNHGKLVNMRPSSVEYRYVSTQLLAKTRHNYSIDLTGWVTSAPGANRLYETLTSLLADWGAFLDLHLYHEAMIHFMGGAKSVVKTVKIEVNGRIAGKQKVCRIEEDAAFHLSAIKTHHASYQKHMVRLLNHSSLRHIHWINLEGLNIQFKTLEKE